MARKPSIRAGVKAIEASGAKFFETAVNEEAKKDLRRDGSYRHPFVDLASVDARHVSVRLEKPGQSKPMEAGRSLGRVSEVDRKITASLVEKSPMSAASIIRAIGAKDPKYVRGRLKLMLERGLIERSTDDRKMYSLRASQREPEKLFDGGSRYTEAPRDVPEKGIFKGDMLELSAAVVKEGDFVMAAREIPSRNGGKEWIAKVIKVWPAFVVLEGGEMRMKVDLFKVTSAFRSFNPPAAEERASS